MSIPINLSGELLVPAAALSVRAVRSSGPGGQNVNKVASKVELRVDLARIEGLRPEQADRLRQRLASRLDAEGRLLVTSQLTRDQSRNLADARDKARRLIESALAVPRARKRTAPTTAAREKRLQRKKRTSEKKRVRGRPPAVDD